MVMFLFLDAVQAARELIRACALSCITILVKLVPFDGGFPNKAATGYTFLVHTILTLNEPPPDSRKEWAVYSPNPVAFGREMALQPAFSVGLRDYDHLDPCMIYHAACLVAVLESYAVYDPQIHI
ncbi:hypothetical protein C4D60_Mb07t10040 [Musa balbisiana]|uniref:Uncharacterized protein n=1 Tax=Musa balbisiana TaxID=52838 RepID=A0A4S8JEF4_MUSBA|nr:hypothetical protein C4D60_Mb07t10040 [Musa balbisiana]